MTKTSFICCSIIVTAKKFNLINDFFISLFMVTRGKVIFICSPEAHLSESITSEILKRGGSFLFQNVRNLI